MDVACENLVDFDSSPGRLGFRELRATDVLVNVEGFARHVAAA
jgi:hypothetical protein